MSDLVQLQPDPAPSRREVLRQIALTATMGGMTVASAQHVHEAAADDKQKASGVYKPQAFTEYQYRSLQRLSDLIIPADAKSPGALAGGAPEFIDTLSAHNAELASIFTGGLAWMDRYCERKYNQPFVECKPAQQTALLDLIAYRKNTTPELQYGIRFFDWARRMTVDAFYTSKVGIAAVGYKGNVGMTEFKIPQEAIDYALKRSPV